MTISTPVPEYLSDTHEVVDEALAQQEDQSPQTQASFKLVPTSEDWMGARTDAFMVVCPVCFAAVYQIEVNEHTAYHQMVAEVFQLLAQ